MKVWRVISLTLWSVVLTVLLIVSGAYYLLSSTVLDQSKATNALRQTGFYDVVRSQVLLPKVQEQLSAGQSASAVLPSQDVLNSVNQVFTADKIRSITDQVLGAAYQWSDNKSPTIDFSIPVANEKDALGKALQAQIQQNVAELPRCGANDEVPDNLAQATCLPLYVSRDTVSSAVISDMQQHLQTVDDKLTPDTLHVTNKDLGSAVNTPDYIGYLWTLNLITLPLSLVIALYLLLKRRGAGLIAIGASILVVGIIGLTAYGALSSAKLASTDNALDNEIIKASQLLIKPTLLLGSGVSTAAGLAAIVGGIFWQRARRQKN